eukprot:snap_masked-scaffold_3-processed-gene-21.46-mRNA-1 protein AED:1.00 eAED:1.00 QI:0/-1/0/0/-1/1/1/0/70
MNAPEKADIPAQAPPVNVTQAPNQVMLNEKYPGAITWVLVILCCLLIGPFSLLFLCCPMDERPAVIRQQA